MNVEKKKRLKPLCPELITKAKMCDVGCPYRHILVNENETGIKANYFINMKLIEVLAPNHFSVHVLGQKRRLEHKSKPVQTETLNVELNEMFKVIHEYYSDEEHREKPNIIEIGDMCIVCRDNNPERCCILSKSTKHAQVYLVDTGKTCKCLIADLHELDTDLKQFPSKIIEVFALGYAPSDKNPNWLPKTKKLIDYKMSTQINGTYFQAQVIEAFDRRLIVKDVKVLTKDGNRILGKYLIDDLIKYKMAESAPIKLHDIFQESPQRHQVGPSDSEIIAQQSASTSNMDELQWKSLTSFPISSNISEEPQDDVPLQNHNNNNQMDANRESNRSSSTGYATQNQTSATSVNSIFCSIERIPLPDSPTFSDSEAYQMQSQCESITVDHSELLGSLSEDIQAGAVLLPIKCSSNDVTDATCNYETDLLIDITECGIEEAKIIPSPFQNVRIINSIDDLL